MTVSQSNPSFFEVVPVPDTELSGSAVSEESDDLSVINLRDQDAATDGVSVHSAASHNTDGSSSQASDMPLLTVSNSGEASVVILPHTPHVEVALEPTTHEAENQNTAPSP